MISANLCAQAIGNGEIAFSVYPLAMHYLDGYLRFPMDDAAFEVVAGKTRDTYNKATVAEDAVNNKKRTSFEYRSIAELSAILEKARKAWPALQKKAGLSGPGTVSPVDPIIVNERLIRDLYAEAIPKYARMVQVSARAFANKDSPDKKRLLEERAKIAKEIISTFVDYSQAVKNPAIEGGTARLGFLNGLHSIYARAQAYAAVPGAGQADLQVAPLELTMQRAIHTIWLNDQALAAVGARSTGPTAPAYFLIKNMGSISFKRQEDALFTFETKLHEFVQQSEADSTKPQFAIELAGIAAQLGLFSSGTSGTSQSLALQILEPYRSSLLGDKESQGKIKAIYQEVFSKPGARLL